MIDLDMTEQTLERTTIDREPEQYSLRDTLLHSRIGRAFSTFVVGLGMSASADIISPNIAGAAPGPITPGQIVKDTNQYEHNVMHVGESMNLRTLVLGSHHLRKNGTCTPQEERNQRGLKVLLTDYSRKGIANYYCSIQPDGSHDGGFLPISKIGNPPALKNMNLAPILQKVGSDSANSVGVLSTMHGNARQVKVNRQNSQNIEADVFYWRGTSTTSGARQLKELKLRVSNGAERVQKIWY